jgi:hypothetical protein
LIAAGGGGVVRIRGAASLPPSGTTRLTAVAAKSSILILRITRSTQLYVPNMRSNAAAFDAFRAPLGVKINAGDES